MNNSLRGSPGVCGTLTTVVADFSEFLFLYGTDVLLNSDSGTKVHLNSIAEYFSNGTLVSNKYKNNPDVTLLLIAGIHHGTAYVEAHPRELCLPPVVWRSCGSHSPD